MAELIVPRRTVSVGFWLEPAYNAVASLALLDLAEDWSGLGEWVYRTAEGMSPEDRWLNRHVLQDAVYHLLGDASWPSFQAWVDDLAARDAVEMRDDVVRALFAKAYRRAGHEMPEPSEVVSDRTTFVTLVEEAHEGRRAHGERALWEDMHGKFLDPPRVQEQIVTYLRAIWEEGLAAEWVRNLSALEESVAAFRSLDMSGLTAMEALTRVSLREVPPPAGGQWLDEVEHLLFIPSVHTGPYLLHLPGLDESTVRIVYGARVPKGAAVRSPGLTRSELLMRLNALANDVRLQVLEWVGQEGERSTTEIMEHLGLSQSAASRHLEHLAATGYLVVRGEKRVKYYRLSPEQIDHTFDALKAFCR
jgi:DNA-binding transcriptional ArsR family regulator